MEILGLKFKLQQKKEKDLYFNYLNKRFIDAYGNLLRIESINEKENTLSLVLIKDNVEIANAGNKNYRISDLKNAIEEGRFKWA